MLNLGTIHNQLQFSNAAAEDTTATEPAIEEVAPEAVEEATEAVEGMAEEAAAETEAVVAE